MLNCIIVGLQYDLGEELDGFREELGLEWESEFSDLSFDLDGKVASEGIYQFVDLVFRIFLGAI